MDSNTRNTTIPTMPRTGLHRRALLCTLPAVVKNLS